MFQVVSASPLTYRKNGGNYGGIFLLAPTPCQELPPMSLTDAAIRAAKPGDKTIKLFDSLGLYLEISPNGGRWWRLKFRYAGKERRISLGVYPTIGLREARKRRDEAKELLAKNIDPSAHKQAEKEAVKRQQEAAEQTFKAVALQWWASYGPTLAERTRDRTQRYLDQDILPALGDKPVASILPADILAVAAPAEKRGASNTAHKLMSISNHVMRHAFLRGLVSINVAAGLRGALRPLKHKPRPAIIEKIELGRLLRDIWAYEGHPSVQWYLRILPYLATRPGELRLARWCEFDFAENVWRVPAGRMKMRRAWNVPLAGQMVKMLRELEKFSGGSDDNYLFPSVRSRSAVITDVAGLAALRSLGWEQKTVCLHGWRSTFSTLANESGQWRPDVVESCLAHADRDSVRSVYNRAGFWQERVALMQWWASYLDALKEAGPD